MIFGEKASLEPIALPIAEEYEADLYLVTGEISDTLVHQIVRDAAEDGRPLVVFTLSDCDPAGRQMAVSIGRKLQAFRDLLFSDIEFELVPVALTPDQVRELNLPSTPLKETEKRADRWRDAFGVDQTEIDALTTPANAAILERLIRQAFLPYIDRSLGRIRAEAETRLETLREQIASINEQLELTAGDIALPPIEVPEPEVELDSDRQALVSFDHDWVEASQALIKHKGYGR